MDNEAFVSVIVPCYNSEQSIEKTIDALLNQTYDKHLYEIIIVDNNSEDRTARIADSKGAVVVKESIQSSYAARNRGIKQAKGDILAFTDADCIPNVDWLSNGIKGLNQSRADLAGGDIQFLLSEKPGIAEYYDAVANLQVKDSIEKRCAAMTANLFIRRHVIDSMGPFPSSIKSGGDIYFTIKASSKGFRIAYIDDACVRHPARGYRSLIKKAIRTAKGKNALKLHKKKDKCDHLSLRGRGTWNHLFPIDLWRKCHLKFPYLNPLQKTLIIMLHYLLIAASCYPIIKKK